MTFSDAEPVSAAPQIPAASPDDFSRRYFQALSTLSLDDMLSLFDEDAHLLRRLLTKSSFSLDATARDNMLKVLTHLSSKRAGTRPQFFREIIRRHIWAMNDEGGNIDRLAPEIIAAVICGNPNLYDGFVTIMFHSAKDEALFFASLSAALDMLEAKNVKSASELKKIFSDNQKK